MTADRLVPLRQAVRALMIDPTVLADPDLVRRVNDIAKRIDALGRVLAQRVDA